MGITQLDIKGFRSLKDVTWKPGALNVLIGANGSGKSNLLRFLELMVVAAEGGLGKHVQSLGGIDAIRWDGQADQVSFKVSWDGEVHIADNYGLRLSVFGPIYIVTSEMLTGGTSGDVLIERAMLEGRIREDVSENWRELKRQSFSSEETLLSAVSTNFVYFYNVPTFKSELSSFTVYHDVQGGRAAPMRQPAVTRYEKRIDPDGQNLISVLHTLYTGDREFERNVDQAMRAAFGDDYEKLIFPPAADQRIQLRVRWRSLKREQSAADLSDGTLRFLFLITALATPDPPPVIAIDEPEVGLHPSMLPIIAEFAADAALRSQVVLTTHSPQLLDAFTELKPTTTVMRWENGETVLRNLNGDELDYWLQGYTLGKLFKSGELESMA